MILCRLVSIDSLNHLQISLVNAMKEEVPTTSCVPQKFDILTGSICMICNGARKYLSGKKKSQKITTKRLETLLTVCEDRQDDIAYKLFPLRGMPELYGLNFYNNCRSSYTCSKKNKLAKKRSCGIQSKVSKRFV